MTTPRSDRVQLFWDFFGPNAVGTAEHFHKHLRELFAAEGIDDCELGYESKGRGHHAVRCESAVARAEELVGRLRPRRVLRGAGEGEQG